MNQHRNADGDTYTPRLPREGEIRAEIARENAERLDAQEQAAAARLRAALVADADGNPDTGPMFVAALTVGVGVLAALAAVALTLYYRPDLLLKFVGSVAACLVAIRVERWMTGGGR